MGQVFVVPNMREVGFPVGGRVGKHPTQAGFVKAENMEQ
jgi:hypothetical protein